MSMYYNDKYITPILKRDNKTDIACDKGILKWLIENSRQSVSAGHLERNFFSEQGKNIVSSMGTSHFDKDGLESILHLLELVED